MYHYAVGNVTHGPVSIEELRAILTPQTLVWREGMANWVLAPEVAELRALFEAPIPEVVIVRPAAPLEDRQLSVPEPQGIVQYEPVKPNAAAPGLAVTSMVLGIVWIPLICAWPVSLVCAVLAVVFGFVGRGQCIRENRPGIGMAWTGIILGLIPIGILAAFFVVMIIAVIGAAISG